MSPARIALAVLAAAALAGCAARAPAERLAGTALHAECRGARSAAPTVILESGAFGSAADWALVLADLAPGGRVCAYDRGGIGRSPERPGPRDARAIALELRGLLDQLHERRPVILVGHSNGALYAETFAALWPERVAGLAYVNGVNSDALDHPDLVRDLDQERRLADLAALAGRLGLSGLVSEIVAGAIDLPEAAQARKREDLASPLALAVARDEDWAVIDGLSAARSLGGSPPAAPTAVVTGDAGLTPGLARAWRQAQAAPALRARRRLLIHLPDATHTSPLAKDRAYVVMAVNWLRSTASKSLSP